MNPMELFLAMGVSFVASACSSRVKDLSTLIQQGMHYPDFAIVHVQSPTIQSGSRRPVNRELPVEL